MKHCFRNVFCAILFTLLSCTTVIEVERRDNSIREVTVSLHDSSAVAGTRLFVQDDNHNTFGMQIQNYIENDDTIGIFPQEGDQIPFIITGLTAPQTSFSFQSKSWDLKSNVKYFAYMPFERAMNFKHYNNVENVYVNYFGQKADKEMCNSDVQYDNVNYFGKSQSYYSYMYSEPEEDIAGTGALNFQLRYLGGWVWVYATMDQYAPGHGKTDTYFVLAKLVATKPIFRAEGTYNLKTVGTNRLSGIPAIYSDITPTSRGLTSVLSVQLDSVQISAMYDDIMFSFAVPPVNFNEDGATCTIYLYDSECNYYIPYFSGSYLFNLLSGSITEGTTNTANVSFRYYGKASPKDMIVEPWEEKDESVNANWNYR